MKTITAEELHRDPGAVIRASRTEAIRVVGEDGTRIIVSCPRIEVENAIASGGDALRAVQEWQALTNERQQRTQDAIGDMAIQKPYGWGIETNAKRPTPLVAEWLVCELRSATILDPAELLPLLRAARKFYVAPRGYGGHITDEEAAGLRAVEDEWGDLGPAWCAYLKANS